MQGVARTVGIGLQSFEKIRERQCFYVDKTKFIKEWWENLDDITLITRPRRFGKTLTMSMTEQFFSVKYAGRGDLFQGLSIWVHQRVLNFLNGGAHGQRGVQRQVVFHS
ncbi:MAG: AAA family ATPase, partial [Lachnospiraceae bacterium]|nr:AAA family ATPase [Lachnospiraceae bacterium]